MVLLQGPEICPLQMKLPNMFPPEGEVKLLYSFTKKG